MNKKLEIEPIDLQELEEVKGGLELKFHGCLIANGKCTEGGCGICNGNCNLKPSDGIDPGGDDGGKDDNILKP